MYLGFYGLCEKPFNPAPDPKFLYLSASHREALARLLYGVKEQQGFVALIGEVGTGKTTLLHTLLQKLDGQASVAFIVNSTLSFDDVLEYMLADFGVPDRGHTTAQRLIALNTFLIERRRRSQNAVLILDEAQNLVESTLEQIRLLSNFEIPGGKLLQIVLVGQPELQARLDQPGLRQLRQRIAIRCRVGPLTGGDVGEYIRTRLGVAGASDLGIFTADAVARIAEFSGGIPRLINIVCEHCLLLGYGDQTRRLTRRTVDHAIHELESPSRPRQAARARRNPGRRRHRWALGGLGAAAAAAVIFMLGLDSLQSIANLLVGEAINLARDARTLVMP